MDSITVPGTLDSLQAIRDCVDIAAKTAGIDSKKAYRLRLAVDEIATNIIVHGYNEANLAGQVNVLTEINQTALTIILEDTAPPFNPLAHPEPNNLDAPLENRNIGGLGVFLARQGTDDFRYEYENGHNRNIFVVNRTISPPTS